MSRIRIKNFGPIKEGLLGNDGWIEVKKATVFIGNQGSGKSAVAKLISTFTWIEKALVRGDYDKKWFERRNKLQNQYLKYHRLENYLQLKGDNKTEIEYQGDAYSIKYADGSLSINETSGIAYSLPQIMYVPAERNFIAYVKTAKELKLSSDSLKEFLTEFENAKDAMKGHVKLPINNSDIEYDKLNDTLNLRGDGYKTKLTDASSGFQSLVPLFLVSDFLAVSVKEQSDKEPMSSDELQRFKKGIVDIWANTSLTDEQRRIALSALSSKFNKTAFVNIVEEPEQNLFPSSQWQTLQCLLEFNNLSEGNKLIITTHSPYIINFLSIAIQAEYLRNKIIAAEKQHELLPRLEKVISGKSLISSASVIVYQLNEVDGTIKTLSAPEGIPTDKNYLNDMLKEGNNLFDTLLEIEEEI